MEEQKTALVTSLGSVAADIVIKSLKRIGFKVIGCDIYPKEWIADANFVDAFYRAPYVSDAKDYLEFIYTVCKKENVNYILPLIDLEVDLLNVNRKWFKDNGIILCISPKTSLDIIRNKKTLADFIFSNCKVINAIPTLMLKEIKELPWAFPIVCKPLNGRSSQGLKYIYNQKEWDCFYQVADKEIYIAEPFIKGAIIMVEIIRQPSTNQTVAIPRKELLATAHGCGTSVMVFQDKELEKNCIELANLLSVVGCVNFEFIFNEEEQKYYFVECNPRFSAGCEFSCISGYECVINHIRCFDDKRIENHSFKHNLYIARKYEEYITRIDVSDNGCDGGGINV